MPSSITDTEVRVPAPTSLISGREYRDASSTDFGVLPIPKRLRYNPDKPLHFGFMLNVLFGFASTFIVANLYYCQPLLSTRPIHHLFAFVGHAQVPLVFLVEFSKYFNVSYSEVSVIPTLIQAGFAVGLLLITPLGDLVRRRQLTLSLIVTSTALTVGLAVTSNLRAFEALCFLIGAASVTPQILMPLAGELATPERKASAMSIVFSGIMLGILVARVLAGIIGNFASWRIVYYMAIGVQSIVLIGAYLLLPDYPPKNRDLTYWNILYTMAKYAMTEPLVIQASLINITASACFSGFWVTLTFLLGGPPYYYSTVDIGLFGLVGVFGVFVGPLLGRLIDKLVPWYATLVATLILVVSQSVQTAAGGINVSAVVIACFGLDAGRQMQQVSLVTAVCSISEAARSRLNAILFFSVLIGQVIGTPVGTDVFVRHGWRACSAFMMALFGLELGFLVLRGPHCPRNHWFGWAGGCEARRKVAEARKTDDDVEKSVARAVADEPHLQLQPAEEMEGKGST